MEPPPQAETGRGSRQGQPTGREIRVLAAVVRRRGRLLVCRRPLHKRHGGRWEFPGGKIEPGESRLEAARRELREELGLEVVAVGDAPLVSARDPGSDFVIEFVLTYVRGEPRAIEHDEVRWVTPSELAGLHLAPADRAFADSLADPR